MGSGAARIRPTVQKGCVLMAEPRELKKASMPRRTRWRSGPCAPPDERLSTGSSSNRLIAKAEQLPSVLPTDEAALADAVDQVKPAAISTGVVGRQHIVHAPRKSV